MRCSQCGTDTIKENKRLMGGLCFSLLVVVSILGLYITFATELSTLKNENCGIDVILQEGVNNLRTSSNTNEVETITKRDVSFMNNTLCDMLTQYVIPHVGGAPKFVSVCLFQNATRIDIRHFINGQPTIRGIWFTVDEWRYLLRLIYEITGDIVMQRNRVVKNQIIK